MAGFPIKALGNDIAKYSRISDKKRRGQEAVKNAEKRKPFTGKTDTSVLPLNVLQTYLNVFNCRINIYVNPCAVVCMIN